MAEAEIRNDITPADYAALMQAEAPGGFDDVIVLDPDPERLDALPPVVAARDDLAGWRRSLSRPVRVDAGRVHYDYVTYLGTTGLDVSAAYGRERNREELRVGGVACIVGGGGPMGRMHLQRMLEMANGPRRSWLPNRMPVATRSFSWISTRWARARKGIELVVLNPKQMTPEAFHDELAQAHGGRGFDDIVVIVASVPAIEAAMPHLASDGLLVVFGGLARGTTAMLDLSPIYLGGAQITGSAWRDHSGDQSNVLAKVAAG